MYIIISRFVRRRDTEKEREKDCSVLSNRRICPLPIFSSLSLSLARARSHSRIREQNRERKNSINRRASIGLKSLPDVFSKGQITREEQMNDHDDLLSIDFGSTREKSFFFFFFCALSSFPSGSERERERQREKKLITSNDHDEADNNDEQRQSIVKSNSRSTRFEIRMGIQMIEKKDLTESNLSSATVNISIGMQACSNSRLLDCLGEKIYMCK